MCDILEARIRYERLHGFRRRGNKVHFSPGLPGRFTACAMAVVFRYSSHSEFARVARGPSDNTLSGAFELLRPHRGAGSASLD
jgi:hypothetical protein